MGTPEFAVPCLEKLIASHHEVLCIVTGPDKPVGRGQKLRETPVCRRARAENIPILKPANLKAPQFRDQLLTYPADLYVVVAFRILPDAVFEIPEQGTINLHGSLLPRYRGAAPINWAIINGEKETGVTTFFIRKKVDTGDMILQRRMPIGDTEDAGSLHDRMSILGAEMLLETVNLIETDDAPRIPQEGEATPAPKLTKELCMIDWSRNAAQIYNLIRGLSPYPRAVTYFGDKQFKICATAPDILDSGGTELEPGMIINLHQRETIDVVTGNGILSITEIQPPNKRRMTAADYLRGHDILEGERFESPQYRGGR
jgi:methionyl-tRNA formyltransferase